MNTLSEKGQEMAGHPVEKDTSVRDKLSFFEEPDICSAFEPQVYAQPDRIQISDKVRNRKIKASFLSPVDGSACFKDAQTIHIESPNENILYVPVRNAGPATVISLKKEDGSFSIFNDGTIRNGLAALKVKGKMEILIYSNPKQFDDVESSHPFYHAIQFAASHQLMNGLDHDGLFGPDLPVSRGMFAQIIYNLYRRPQALRENSFRISKSAYYYDAVNFVHKMGLMNGYSSRDFGADDDISRQQLITVLWRLWGCPKVSFHLDHYPDAGLIEPFAQEAMKWAVSKGIIYGFKGHLMPQSNLPRYQAALILERAFGSLY